MRRPSSLFEQPPSRATIRRGCILRRVITLRVFSEFFPLFRSVRPASATNVGVVRRATRRGLRVDRRERRRARRPTRARPRVAEPAKGARRRGRRRARVRPARRRREQSDEERHRQRERRAAPAFAPAASANRRASSGETGASADATRPVAAAAAARRVDGESVGEGAEERDRLHLGPKREARERTGLGTTGRCSGRRRGLQRGHAREKRRQFRLRLPGARANASSHPAGVRDATARSVLSAVSVVRGSWCLSSQRSRANGRSHEAARRSDASSEASEEPSERRVSVLRRRAAADGRARAARATHAARRSGGRATPRPSTSR